MKTNNFMPKKKNSKETISNAIKKMLPKIFSGRNSLKDKFEKAKEDMILWEAKK